MPRADTQTPTPGKQPPSARLGPREWQLGARTHARQCQRGNGAGGRERGLATSASSAHLQEPRRGQGVASVCVWGGVGVARLGQRRWHPQALPCDRYFWIVRGPAPATRPKRCFRNFGVGAGLPLPPPHPRAGCREETPRQTPAAGTSCSLRWGRGSSQPSGSPPCLPGTTPLHQRGLLLLQAPPAAPHCTVPDRTPVGGEKPRSLEWPARAAGHRAQPQLPWRGPRQALFLPTTLRLALARQGCVGSPCFNLGGAAGRGWRGWLWLSLTGWEPLLHRGVRSTCFLPSRGVFCPEAPPPEPQSR